MSNWHGGKGSKRRNPNEEIFIEKTMIKSLVKRLISKFEKKHLSTERLKSTKTKPNTIEKTLKSLRRN